MSDTEEPAAKISKLEAKMAPLTKKEVSTLITLVEAHPEVTSRATHALNNAEKMEAWKQITVKFNDTITSGPRKPEQLRLKWENLKKAARKRSAIRRMSNIEDVAEAEEMDHGQEEWLSEEILTDDDYNPRADQDQSDSNANTSQEEGNNDSTDQVSQDTGNSTGENIEVTLNNLENATTRVQAELPEELGPFLVRKTEARVEVVQQATKEPESDLDESTKQSEDDGNDTDDLLRMLGEGNDKKKDVPAAQLARSTRAQVAPHSSDEDDDEYIFKGGKMTRLQVSKDYMRNNENTAKKLKGAKGMFIQKQTASRAVPEDTSDREADNDVSLKVAGLSNLKAAKAESKEVVRTGKIISKMVKEDLTDADEDSFQSSDEAMTVKRMFDVHRTKVITSGSRGMGPRRRGINAVKTVTKRVIKLNQNNVTPTDTPRASPNPSVKTYAKSSGKPKGIPSTKPISVTETRVQNTSQDDMDDEENLHDDSQDIESEAEEESGQRLMQPERMDEEVPSDGESHTDEDSYYDELPSSESEDADDWFTLDIRAERAAEYIPMLGDRAKAMLTAEQQRAAARLGALQRSASALIAGRRSLAAQLRIARSSITQLDAALTQ